MGFRAYRGRFGRRRRLLDLDFDEPRGLFFELPDFLSCVRLGRGAETFFAWPVPVPDLVLLRSLAPSPYEFSSRSRAALSRFEASLQRFA